MVPPLIPSDERCNSKYTWKTNGGSNSIIAAVIGEEVRKARIAAGLSQEELGFRSKFSRNYVSMVELNQNSPTLDTLIRICHVLGVRAATLVARHEREMQRQKPMMRRRGPR
jgi:ribosome-binding protein aMBF1 (putative translation factor)